MRDIFFVLNQIRLRVLAIPLIFCMLGLGHSALYAQTATVTAVNDLSCIGDRIGRNGICTAKEFTTVLTFGQPAANTLSWPAMETVQLWTSYKDSLSRLEKEYAVANHSICAV